jgi:hypothetical protein
MAAWSREAPGAVGRGDAAAADAFAGFAFVVEDVAAAVVAPVIIAQSSELTELAAGARASGPAPRLAVAAYRRDSLVRSRRVVRHRMRAGCARDHF